MIEYLYRLRSIDALLGKREELERQEIYFSSLDQLNDPMEGYKDIFWVGDRIVWKNLLKHYLLCLERLCVLALLSPELTPLDIPIFITEDKLPTESYKETFRKICSNFFKNDLTEKYIQFLSSAQRPIRREELIWHLTKLHNLALSCIFLQYENQKLMKKNAENALFHDLVKDYSINSTPPLALDRVLNNQVASQVSDYLWVLNYNFISQLALINKYNSVSNPISPKKEILFLSFPEHYVLALEKLIYPEWYVACFLGNVTNPAMWAHYANGHRGVCLKFKIRRKNETPIIRLNGVKGWQSGKISHPVHLDSDFRFYKVNYSKNYPEVDFFRSLGRPSASALQSFWYKSESGEESACGEGVFKNKEEWHRRYWEEFNSGVITKLKDWAYENEYRLVLYGLALDYCSPEHRVFKYYFEDLEGIIFGINTTSEEKMRIFKIIENKCIREGRTDFNFYQAYYSRGTSEISILSLNLVKFRIDKKF